MEMNRWKFMFSVLMVTVAILAMAAPPARACGRSWCDRGGYTPSPGRFSSDYRYYGPRDGCGYYRHSGCVGTRVYIWPFWPARAYHHRCYSRCW